MERRGKGKWLSVYWFTILVHDFILLDTYLLLIRFKSQPYNEKKNQCKVKELSKTPKIVREPKEYNKQKRWEPQTCSSLNQALAGRKYCQIRVTYVSKV